LRQADAIIKSKNGFAHLAELSFEGLVFSGLLFGKAEQNATENGSADI